MKIGFIGCGNMGSAMIGGILKKGIFQKEEIIVSNLTEEGARRSREKLGVAATLDNREVVRSTRLLVLAVKPQFYEEVLEEVKDLLTTEHMVVGIAPGKTLAWLEKMREATEGSKADAEYSRTGRRRYDRGLYKRACDRGGCKADS